MSRAYSSVLRDGLSVRYAAELYNVPRSTLGDRVSGKVLDGSKSGKPRYLTEAEEEELVQFLFNCASIGYPRSRREVLAIVQQICDHRNKDAVVSHGWWERFCQRHSNLSLRSASLLSNARVKGSTPDIIDAYFDILEDTLVEYNLLDKPGSVFNMDETGMPFNPKGLKVVAEKGVKNVSSISSDKKTQITVVGCISAAGFAIPPMVVWDRKTLHPDMTVGEIPGTFYGLTHNGWMDQELFESWLTCHFLRYAPSVRPLLLLMDGHSSHYCPDAIRVAAREQVVLFTFPPNTTHLSQPLDRACFGPLKISWRRVCQDFFRLNPGKAITRFSFSALFAEAWKAAMTMQNIIAGFRVTGIFPLDRTKLKELPSSATSAESSSASSGLSYIPLLSPAPSRKRNLSSLPVFSEEEMFHFHDRYRKKRGKCSSDDDERYYLWQKMYHPHHECSGEVESSFDDSFIHTPLKKGETASVAMLARPGRTIQHLLKCPSPPTKLPSAKPKKSCRVLTSGENIKNIEEKQKKKEEAAQLKQMKQKKREEKQRSVSTTKCISSMLYTAK